MKNIFRLIGFAAIAVIIGLSFASCGDDGPKDVPVTSVSLNRGSISLMVGETETLTATVFPRDATNKDVTWSSSDTSKATVIGGLVTGVSAGTATITVRTVDGGRTDTCTVTVTGGGGGSNTTSLDGVWECNGVKVTISGNTGKISYLPTLTGLWGNAITKGYVSVDSVFWKSIARSTGTLTWSAQELVVRWSGSNTNATGIDYDSCTLTMSSDGQTLTDVRSNDSNNLTWTRLSGGSGGSGGGSDSMTWTAVDTFLGTIEFNAIVYGGDKFVALGQDISNGNGKAVYSTDGITWTAVDLGGYYDAIAYGGGKFVAGQVDNSLGKVAYSTNGINWTVDAPFGEMGNIVNIKGIAYGNGKFVIPMARKIAYSSDGVSWESVNIAPSNQYNNLASGPITWGNGKFVVLSGNTSVWTSEDGINWTERTTSINFTYSNYIAFGGGKFVADASNINKFAYSSDGITWEPITIASLNSFNGLAYGNNKFVTTHSMYYKVFYSSDGINWTDGGMYPSFNAKGIAYGNGKFVGVTQYGQIFYSIGY